MRHNTKAEKVAPPAEVQKLLTVAQVAAILGLSKVKVYGLLKTGLPSVKIDGARRIQPGKLQTWIDQHSDQ
ncbi:MAG: helix-turn-helix domain-containing protein [Ktedonobacteraceae bacterium]|nr:helix-turn-helix domain-containing protein [Ktedonobacteraceae bacterium]